MAFQSYIRLMATHVVPLCRGRPSYRKCVVRCAGGGARRTALAPVQRDDVTAPAKRETVMRVGEGGVEIVNGAVVDSVEGDVQQELLHSVPQIDPSSFRDYIEVPKIGMWSLMSHGNERLLSNGVIPFKRYVEGSPNAHHYPLSLLPRKLAAKLGGDLMVTTYAMHEKDYEMEGTRRVMLSALPTLKEHPCEVLLQKLYGSNSLLIVFSGDPPYADVKGALEWRRAVDFDVHSHILLNYPAPIGMSHFHKRYVKALAGSLVERNRFSCIVRKLSAEETVAFHQYRRQFTSVLLLDKFGYIRWHAAGRPTNEARYLLKEAYEELQREA
ncbi:uncharacterized protein BcabD6B2_50390 [Babesia caballi]|uniref:Uncharacterized protein n=1 Tax=Babesia caballi TaxID=5871 RepID=A0AAV4LZS3_BABCB|nr:hypothetical protein, conserved [Babesia caballi]